MFLDVWEFIYQSIICFIQSDFFDFFLPLVVVFLVLFIIKFFKEFINAV